MCEAEEQRLVYRLQEQENKFVAAQRQFEASNVVSGEDCASLKPFLITYRAQRSSCWASQELARAAHKHGVAPVKMGGVKTYGRASWAGFKPTTAFVENLVEKKSL